ncbi:DNA-binding SARP family transcriptional activator [Kitasatospora sp. MAP12-15]|uniref:AfsR/SARP family transcriptional regulator n=1 Tax=unclassified Kitasatospora TaxID=2633591 RepID=UPI0024743914|nr:BTAD domain-containing putative transcriptional regulator [Kitasatospora sp. MAP12-44]MDH6112591.1 DNA-binding SARP family transcriptional activator [Kitasatospora sp. MAP12-44]
MELQATQHDAVLRFQVLGPVQAWRGDQALALGSPQQQAVLTALLLNRGRPVTTQELVDGLWGDRPPPQAVAALRTYISRLRSVIEPGREVRAPAELLVSVRDGYVLRVSADALDLAVFDARFSDANQARQVGEAERAHQLLVSALALWSGQPLAGIPGPYADSQRLRLTERRVTAWEERFAAALDIGLHADVASELKSLATEHPLRERLRELLMLALYQCGRQAEALNVYAATRKLLIDELGVEPGISLAAMHSRILSADPTLMYAPPEPVSPAPESGQPALTAPPAQLPADISDFSGRDPLVTELRDALRSASGQAVVVTSLAGIGGVGKTTLAVHVAHSVRNEFPDGQLYVDLRGAGATPADPAMVLGDFLFALGVAEAPEPFEQRVALYRSLLADRRMLILLDNAHDVTQVAPLIPGVAGCAVLATSRSRLAGLPGAHLVDVEELSPQEALELFAAIVGQQRTDAEPEAALAVVTACGFLPLAVRIAAARLASRPRWSVSDLARRLADQRRRLDELQLGNLAVETTLGLGYGQLKADEARAFRLLASVDSPDLPLAAVAALLGTTEDQAEDLAEALVEANMLECFTPGRYRYHDLLRLFAQKQADKFKTQEEEQAGLLRLLDLLLATLRNAAQTLEPDDLLAEALHHPAQAGIRFETTGTARGWLRAEFALLLATMERVVEDSSELMRRAVDVLIVLRSLVEERIHGERIRRILDIAARSAASQADEGALARIRFALGVLGYMAGDFPDSESSLRECLDLLSPTETPILRSTAASLLGTVLSTTNRPAQALPFFEQARELLESLEAKSSEARVLGNIARAHLALGQRERAVSSAESALVTARMSNNAYCLTDTLYQLGVVLGTAGSPAQAATHLREAYQRYQEQQQRFWEGLSLARLAGCLLTDGQVSEAAVAADEALTIAEEVDNAYCQGLANAALGEALLRQGQPDRGLSHLHDALGIFTRLGVPEALPVQDLIDAQHTEPPTTPAP